MIVKIEQMLAIVFVMPIKFLKSFDASDRTSTHAPRRSFQLKKIR